MNELYHHGILGMKWGKRNGPPYPLSDSNHSQSEKKARWRKSLSSTPIKKKTKIFEKAYYDQYKAESYSKEDARKAAEYKAKMLKRIAIGAGVVVGAGIAAYVYKEYGRKFGNNLIRSGSTIQTLSMDPDRMKKGLAFYTAYTKSDKAAYMSWFSKDGITGENKKIIQALVNKNIKIAGQNTGKKVFTRLVKTDPQFASAVKDILKHSPKRDGIKTDYARYNAALVFEEYNAIHEKFYKALRELGYGGVADLNDRLNPDIKTNAAVIFDKSSIMETFVNSITNEQINEATKKYAIDQVKSMLMTPLNEVISGTIAITAAGEVIDKRNAKKYKGR